MTKFVIDQELADALHRYLMQRPMAEVEQLVLGLRAGEPLAPPQGAEDDKS